MAIRKSLCVLLCIILLTGCSSDWLVGDGRGDWTLELCAGYAVSRINAHEILVGHKNKPDAPGYEIVIPNYFVTAYQIQKPYICFQGIPTQGSCITDEERLNGKLSYYLIDTVSGEVNGPYPSYIDFLEYCRTIPLELTQEWNYTSEYNRG